MLPPSLSIFKREVRLVVGSIGLADLVVREIIRRPRTVTKRVAFRRHVEGLLPVKNDAGEILRQRQGMRNAIRQRVEIKVAWQQRSATSRQRISSPDRWTVDHRFEADVLQGWDQLHRGEDGLFQAIK